MSNSVPSWCRVGAKVVRLIDGGADCVQGESVPKKGCVYTIREVVVDEDGHAWLRLVEIVNPVLQYRWKYTECNWDSASFAPVVDDEIEAKIYHAKGRTSKISAPEVAFILGSDDQFHELANRQGETLDAAHATATDWTAPLVRRTQSRGLSLPVLVAGRGRALVGDSSTPRSQIQPLHQLGCNRPDAAKSHVSVSCAASVETDRTTETREPCSLNRGKRFPR